MEGWLVVAGIVAALALGVAVALWRKRTEPAPVVVPPRPAWKGGAITPAGLGPRNKTPERVARGVVLTQAVLLAVEMARADDDIDEAEKNAIRQFVRDHVPEADEAQATRALEDGLATKATPETVEAAIATLRNIASEEQLKLILQLFAHVAQADGHVRDQELAFMERIGVELGLAPADVHALVHARA